MEPRKEFAFWPEQASNFAVELDALYLYLVAFSLVLFVLVSGFVFIFAIKYRRRHPDEVPAKVETSKLLEIGWTVAPFLLIIPIFVWGANLYFKQMRAPRSSMEILCTGKQWMWKFQHPNGRREINDLHLPVNVPVKIQMGSEDVIHSLFIPAFRTKQDVLPGRYTSTWFQPTKVGEYHLFCNQYCGTNHSAMIGTVYVMEQADYQAWVSGYTGAAPAELGAELFNKYACNTCHVSGSNARGPNLNNLFGTKVGLQDGRAVVADANYIRESILNPQTKVVAGFQPIMPTFQGTLTEEQVSHLVAYIRSLSSAGESAAGGADKSTENTTATVSAVAPPNDQSTTPSVVPPASTEVTTPSDSATTQPQKEVQ